MGCCSKCGNKIRYNAFKKIKGIIYCLKCVPKECVSSKLFDTVNSAKLDFDEFQKSMEKVTAIVEYNEPIKKKPKKRKRSKKKSGK